ncbi:GNAT family N-acetyltransferase [Lacrimispora saccharolytica]|uniref:GNAT family N-acetyltransferase n=1 Tax=Lacrimispora saccharolytica TaxID=84030 RepID=UPI00265C91B4|nr:GNAT family N-acetyltransferase [Lacrimispora saccharolytica]MBS7329839.1 GNAT family N-acetyltransferase [Lachnospiraceae bacterium]MCF2657301.1 GNAT family N-acetyltransferase [Lacrimispora saccharolytica]MCI7558396.1 GNAT family N-acetyltransferase [Lachnospiraceae bacterium]MDD7547442.1 GNAT family N-acetyltransferase [Lachnospiraceae bacterium]
MSIEIRAARAEEWDDAMALAYAVFLKYESKEYGREGTEAFLNFISDELLYKLFLQGHYKLIVALCDDRIVGVASLRNGTHLSLLFVDDKYHRRGIARAMMYRFKDYLVGEGESFITVNASPYATEFYHKVGFVSEGPMQKKDGMIFTPMKWEFGN